jgi:TPR repeat protein
MVKNIPCAIFVAVTIMVISSKLAFSSDLAKQTIDQLKIEADKGDPPAQYELGCKYYYADGVPKDNVQAVQWWQKSAEKGDLSADVALGFAYEKGVAVKQDFGQAVKWYGKAANQKDPEGEFFLALCYAFGRGVPKDIQKAVLLCEEAAMAGLRQAQRTRGVGFYYGDVGYTQDDTKAFFWFKKAAAQGDPPANYYLGLCYENGRGTETNLVEATKCLRVAADADYANAEDELGTCYVYGRGIGQNFSQAGSWLKKAADQGNPEGQMHLGLMCLYGVGVEKDSVEAYKWFILASLKDQATGNVGFVIMKKYGFHLTSDEIAEAMRRVDLFKVAHLDKFNNPNGTNDFPIFIFNH